eukprot:11153555-Alexandrium_andersonii.AAC.1
MREPIRATAASKRSRSVMGATAGPRSGATAWAGGAAGGGRLLPAGAATAGERGGSAALPGWLRGPVVSARSPRVQE